MIQSAIHAREYMSTAVVMAQIDYMLAHPDHSYDENRTVADVLGDTCFYIVPMANPDGVEIVLSGILPTGLNGDPTAWKANCNGVDLNRNFDAEWNRLKNGVTAPASEGYKGTSPESEPESKALADLVREVEFDLVLSYHTTGSVIYWKFGDYPVNDVNMSIALRLSALTGYRLAFQDDDSLAGFKDWLTILGTPSLTLELGTMLPPNKIQDFENCWARSKDVLLFCADYVKGRIEK